MAHRSYVSPDGEWVLVAEMDVSAWLPSRRRSLLMAAAHWGLWLVREAAAVSQSAAWSPDGKSMLTDTPFFGALHIWRRRFP